MEKAQARILIAANNRATRTLLELALSEAGFQVFSAPSGNSALLQMDVVAPQLVVLDGQLPEMDGWEPLRRIRERSTVPIVVFAGPADDAGQSCLEAGADVCLPNPLDIQELDSQVRALLARERALPLLPNGESSARETPVRRDRR
jgi:DNA-binding response OmpR family regulator